MNFPKSTIFSFSIPATVTTGVGASEKVGEAAKRLGARRALVVTDPGVAKLGYADQIVQWLARLGLALRFSRT